MHIHISRDREEKRKRGREKGVKSKDRGLMSHCISVLFIEGSYISEVFKRSRYLFVSAIQNITLSTMTMIVLITLTDWEESRSEYYMSIKAMNTIIVIADSVIF